MTVTREIPKTYCECLYPELEDMRRKVLARVGEIERLGDSADEHIKSHVPLLKDIAKTIEWKREVMMRACPGAWMGLHPEVETGASVQVHENLSGTESLGGYAGG